jgi:hypothetical protein
MPGFNFERNLPHQQKAVNSLYNKVNSTIPKGSKILFIDNNLNNEIIFKSVMHDYNIFEYNNFSSSTRSLKKLVLGKNSIIDNHVTANINIYKNINQYKYIVINEAYVQSYLQYLIPLGFKFNGVNNGYDIFQKEISKYQYFNLTKLNGNNFTNNTYTIQNGTSSNLAADIPKLKNNKNSVVAMPIYAFGNEDISINSKTYNLNKGYNLIVLKNISSNINITNLAKSPILIPNVSVINKSQMQYVNTYKKTVLKLYNSFSVPAPLQNIIFMHVGQGVNQNYLYNFRNINTFGKNNTYRFIKENSAFLVPILGNFSSIYVKIYTGMFGLSGRTTSIRFSTPVCHDVYNYTFAKNDYTDIIKFNVPASCITNNYLKLYFSPSLLGNKILFTHILLQKK